MRKLHAQDAGSHNGEESSGSPGEDFDSDFGDDGSIGQPQSFAAVEALAGTTPDGFGDDGFGDDGFGDDGFGDDGFGDNGFGDNGFGDNGFGNSGFGSADADFDADFGDGFDADLGPSATAEQPEEPASGFGAHFAEFSDQLENANAHVHANVAPAPATVQDFAEFSDQHDDVPTNANAIPVRDDTTDDAENPNFFTDADASTPTSQGGTADSAISAASREEVAAAWAPRIQNWKARLRIRGTWTRGTAPHKENAPSSVPISEENYRTKQMRPT